MVIVDAHRMPVDFRPEPLYGHCARHHDYCRHNEESNTKLRLDFKDWVRITTKIVKSFSEKWSCDPSLSGITQETQSTHNPLCAWHCSIQNQYMTAMTPLTTRDVQADIDHGGDKKHTSRHRKIAGTAWKLKSSRKASLGSQSGITRRGSICREVNRGRRLVYESISQLGDPSTTS